MSEKRSSRLVFMNGVCGIVAGYLGHALSNNIFNRQSRPDAKAEHLFMKERQAGTPLLGQRAASLHWTFAYSVVYVWQTVCLVYGSDQTQV